jgi:hypothetical protein
VRPIIRSLLAVGWLLGQSAIATAHPGHGDTPASGLEHYVTEPIHSVWFWGSLIAAAVLVTGCFKAVRLSPRR